MNSLIRFVADLTGEHPLAEKILIVPSHLAGDQVRQSLARFRGSWVNLRPRRLRDLAREVLDLEPGDVVSHLAATALVESILEDLWARGRLEYLGALKEGDALADLVAGCLLRLRMAGLTSAELSPEDFVNPQKGHEIAAVMDRYERALEERGAVDQALLFRLAAPAAEEDSGLPAGALVLVPEDMELSVLERTFLSSFLKGEQCEVVPGEPVFGLSRPPGLGLSRGRRDSGQPGPWSYLYGEPPGEGAPSLKADIFRAESPSLEVREIFRLLSKWDVPPDQAEIILPSARFYQSLIAAAGARLEIPVTFASGTPALKTSPGQLLEGLLEWIESRYSASRLRRLLMEGLLDVERPMTAARLLLRASVGWSRDRYARCLAELVDGMIERGSASAEAAASLRDLVDRLLSDLPGEDDGGSIPLGDLCRGLARVVRDLASVRSPEDRAAREELSRCLEEAGTKDPGPASPQRAAGRIRRLVEAIRVSPSSPRPGSLHVSGVEAGLWGLRPYTFVLGLDADAFPGAGLQDPLLLDSERARISPHLRPRASRPARNLYAMVRFLASRRGWITLSYSCRHPAEGRPAAPASLLLEVFRLIQGREADYSRLESYLGAPVSHFTRDHQASLTQEEWWLSGTGQDCLSPGGEENLGQCYPALAGGLRARRGRQSPAVTLYDGLVEGLAGELDPRLNPDRILSPTGLETLAGCPFRFFIRSILGVSPPEEADFETGPWLAPPERGRFLHRLFQDYLRWARSEGRDPAAEAARLQELARESLIELERDIPVPGPALREHQEREILRDLEVFLSLEGSLSREGYRPLYLEVPFGLGTPAVRESGLGSEDPLCLDLPSGGVVRLRGAVDRVDAAGGEGRYAVWDYKTGSTYGFAEGQVTARGQQLQPPLYALAARALLRNSGADPQARVEVAGYLFPSARGEGRKVERPPEAQEKALEVLDLLSDIMGAGAFLPQEEESRCRYCDYPTVCRREDLADWVKRKLGDPENDETGPWRELQNHE